MWGVGRGTGRDDPLKSPPGVWEGARRSGIDPGVGGISGPVVGGGSGVPPRRAC